MWPSAGNSAAAYTRTRTDDATRTRTEIEPTSPRPSSHHPRKTQFRTPALHNQRADRAARYPARHWVPGIVEMGIVCVIGVRRCVCVSDMAFSYGPLGYRFRCVVIALSMDVFVFARANSDNFFLTDSVRCRLEGSVWFGGDDFFEISGLMSVGCHVWKMGFFVDDNENFGFVGKIIYRDWYVVCLFVKI